ncbi:hypothetical protein Tco_0087390 [Tanacetum coccineum]
MRSVEDCGNSLWKKAAKLKYIETVQSVNPGQLTTQTRNTDVWGQKNIGIEDISLCCVVRHRDPHGVNTHDIEKKREFPKRWLAVGLQHLYEKRLSPDTQIFMAIMPCNFVVTLQKNAYFEGGGGKSMMLEPRKDTSEEEMSSRDHDSASSIPDLYKNAESSGLDFFKHEISLTLRMRSEGGKSGIKQSVQKYEEWNFHFQILLENSNTLLGNIRPSHLISKEVDLVN